MQWLAISSSCEREEFNASSMHEREDNLSDNLCTRNMFCQLKIDLLKTDTPILFHLKHIDNPITYSRIVEADTDGAFLIEQGHPPLQSTGTLKYHPTLIITIYAFKLPVNIESLSTRATTQNKTKNSGCKCSHLVVSKVELVSVTFPLL